MAQNVFWLRFKIVGFREPELISATYTSMSSDYYNIDPKTNNQAIMWDIKKAVGPRLYDATIIQSNISASVNILGNRNKKHGEADRIAMEKLIRYLKTTKYFKFVINKKNSNFSAYCDLDWACSRSDKKSTIG